MKKKKILSIVIPIIVLGVIYFLYQYFTYVKTDNAEISLAMLLDLCPW